MIQPFLETEGARQSRVEFVRALAPYSGHSNLSMNFVVFFALLLICSVEVFGISPCAFHFQPANETFAQVCPQLPEHAPSLRPDFMTQGATEKYRSRSPKDIAVLVLYNDMTNGSFVDLSANHWDVDSASYVMEYYNNWKGICVEPSPSFLQGLLSNRKCKIFTSLIGKQDGESESISFHFNREESLILPGDTISTVEKVQILKRNVTKSTLTTLLDFAQAPKVMDYLNLDAGGHEQSVLLGLKGKKYRFEVVTVDRPKYRTHYLLSKQGYRFLYQMSTAGDCIYLHQQKHDFKALVAKYLHPADVIPVWHSTARPYLLHPMWNETHEGEPLV
jgi:FkbM family methyltransferase